MDVLKTVLSAREDKSPQVEALLQCLQDPSFNLQVCICSVGGVGSTELGNFLTRAGLRCNLLTDQDAIRHINKPPVQLGSGTRIVYLFGDPLACVASHYRRNIAYHQAVKTSGNPGLNEQLFPPTFQDYLDRGEDLFGLAVHLHNWLHTSTEYDVLFVRYECMFDPGVAQTLFQYACGPDSPNRCKTTEQVAAMAAEFAASKRQRASQISKEQRQAMYARLAAEMDALPPIFLRRGRDCQQVQLLGLSVS